MQKELAMMISGTLLFGVLLVTLPRNLRSRGAEKASAYSASVSPAAKLVLAEQPFGDSSTQTGAETAGGHVGTTDDRRYDKSERDLSGEPGAKRVDDEDAARLRLDEHSYLATMAAPDSWPIRDWSIALPQMTASSSVVMLADSEKVLFEHNSTDQMPIASITKLLAALTALERGDPQMVIEISEEASEEEGKTWFSAGEHFALSQLILFMLLPSSNEAAKQVWLSLGREEFTLAMNAKARALGMKVSYFTNASGLHDPRHHSSSYDVALLLRAVLKHEFLVRSMTLQSITLSSEEGRAIMVQNSNKLFGKVPRLIIGKTGFTNESRETLAAVTEEGETSQKVLFVILGSDDRFADMQRLIEWTRKAYKF